MLLDPLPYSKHSGMAVRRAELLYSGCSWSLAEAHAACPISILMMVIWFGFTAAGERYNKVDNKGELFGAFAN